MPRESPYASELSTQRSASCEEASWIGGLVILGIVVLLAEEAVALGWGRRNPANPTSHLPGLLAAFVGATVAFRVGWLLRARERGAVGAWLALSSLLQAWSGVSSSAFVLVCALLGTLGLRGQEYNLAVDVAIKSLVATAPLALVELVMLVQRACSSSRAWSVHLIGPLAWFLGPVVLFTLGLAFLLA